MSARARRRARLLFIAPLVALPLLLTACDIDVDTDAESSTVEYEVPEAVRALSVESSAGNVKVTEADVARVFVKERRHYDDKEPTTRHEVENGVLTLDYSCAKRKACFVAYEVTVPRGGIGVTVDTDAGAVTLRDLSGAVDVRTTAGKVDGEGLTADTLRARTNAGAIDVAFTEAPTEVDAETDAGRATVRVPAGRAYAVDVDTTIGDTDIKVERDDSSPHRIRVHTSAGQARLLTT